jgi:Concanavalin A-like lectin/glucanases superfamily
MLSSFTGATKFGRGRRPRAITVLELDAFNYGGSGTWQDATTNANNATVQGTPGFTNSLGLSDYFSLNPANGDYFTVNDNSSLDSMASISVLMWININSVNSSGPNILFSKRLSTSDGYIGFFTTTGWTFRFGTGTGTGITYNTAPATTVWQQVVVTIGPGGSKIYINDAQVASSGYTGNSNNINNTAALDLFEVNPRPQVGPVKMNGKVGVVKIYKGVLTLADVQSEYSIYKNRYTPVVTGLTMKLSAANYPGTGTTWVDPLTSGSGVTLVNSPTYTAGSPSYFTFASASSQSATGTVENVVPPFAYTKSIWVYLNSYADNNFISSETGGHYMFMNGESRVYAGHSNVTPYTGAGAFGSLTTLSLNTWHFVAVTYATNNGIKLYFNGELDASAPTYQTNHTGDGSTNIGRFGAGNFLDGRVGEVYCYGRELMDIEIRQLYNATKATYGF